MSTESTCSGRFIRKAISLGIDVRLGMRVASLDPEELVVHTELSETYTANLIVGADGLWSKCRETLTRHQRRSTPYWRPSLPHSSLHSIQLNDQDLRDWVLQALLPYLAHGANSSIEDGAVKSKGQLRQATKLYEKLPKSRGEAVVRETFPPAEFIPYA